MAELSADFVVYWLFALPVDCTYQYHVLEVFFTCLLQIQMDATNDFALVVRNGLLSFPRLT